VSEQISPHGCGLRKARHVFFHRLEESDDPVRNASISSAMAPSSDMGRKKKRDQSQLLTPAELLCTRRDGVHVKLLASQKRNGVAFLLVLPNADSFHCVIHTSNVRFIPLSAILDNAKLHVPRSYLFPSTPLLHLHLPHGLVKHGDPCWRTPQSP
jgi:hypothetical protein